MMFDKIARGAKSSLEYRMGVPPACRSCDSTSAEPQEA